MANNNRTAKRVFIWLKNQELTAEKFNENNAYDE